MNLKKTLIAVISIMMILGFLTTNDTLAVNDTQAKINVDGEDLILNKVNVNVDGRKIKTDVPAVNYKGNTVVPIRFVSEELGAEVGWDAKSRSAIITTKDKHIELKVNSSKAIVNGKEQALPQNGVTKIMSTDAGADSQRTMVPLRFVSETLGADVEWVDATKTANITSKNNASSSINKIQGIEKQTINGKEAIVIKNTYVSNFNSFSLSDPDRIVIDIRNTDINNMMSDISTDTIKSIRVGQHIGSETDSNEKVARLVLDVSENLENIDYKIEQSENDILIYANIIVKEPKKLQSISKKAINGKEAIVVKNSSASKFSTFTLTEPDRIVVDVRDTELNDVTSNISTDVIKELRLSQYAGSEYDASEKVTRLVLDVKENYENVKSTIDESGDDLIIYVEGNKKGPNKIQSIEKQMINGKEAIVIKNSNVSKFNSFSLTNPSRLVVDMRDTELNDVTSNVSTKIVKSLRYSQYEGSEYDTSEKVSRLVVDMKENYENIKSTIEEKGKDIIIYVDGTQKVAVVPPVVKPPVVVPPKNGKVIVLDAGHGGNDPGAVANGIREKDVALSASLKTREKLELLGYKVIMTRTTDVYPSLASRYRLANNNKADAFLSIHFNAATPAATGIETLYSTKNSKNKAFASSVQSEMVSETGARNRGTKLRNNLAVLNGTRGVSALAELGFITNPKDAAQMKFGDYIEKCATALANGIHKFFSK